MSRLMPPMAQNIAHRDADHVCPADEGWPQFVVMTENGFDEVHRGAADISFQRNIAKHLAAEYGQPAFVFMAVERWMPDGRMEPV